MSIIGNKITNDKKPQKDTHKKYTFRETQLINKNKNKYFTSLFFHGKLHIFLHQPPSFQVSANEHKYIQVERKGKKLVKKSHLFLNEKGF